MKAITQFKIRDIILPKKYKNLPEKLRYLVRLSKIYDWCKGFEKKVREVENYIEHYKIDVR